MPFLEFLAGNGFFGGSQCAEMGDNDPELACQAEVFPLGMTFLEFLAGNAVFGDSRWELHFWSFSLGMTFFEFLAGNRIC